MYDSYTELILPFGSSAQRKEEYINASGGIRMGKLMEHLDSLAGSISYKHMLGPGVQTLGRIQERGFYIVTASVDRLDMLTPLNPSRDLRLSGQVIHTGNSSMEVAVKMETIGSGQPDETVLLGRFSMVCRDANTHKARQVNPLIISTPEERSLYALGEHLKKRRQAGVLRSLSRVPPTSAEAAALHEFYLQHGQYGRRTGEDDSQGGERIWMGDTRLEKSMLMFPQERNGHSQLLGSVHQKVFGGYLMRLAYELGFVNSSILTRGPVRFLSLDGISFARPVPIGSILRLTSQILHTSTPPDSPAPMLVHVGVKANVVDVKTGTEQTTNDFRFTWCREGEGVPRKVVPKTYQGQNNKEACFRLVRRSARILLDINEQMEGRWDTAPPTLIRNLEKFQATLASIHEFTKALTDATWARRFMKKTTIENSIIDFSAQLEDAAQSFQIATLIDIHYAVSARVKEQQRSTISEPLSPPPPYRSNTTSSSQSRDSAKFSVTESRSSSLALIESPIEMEEEKEPVSLSPTRVSDAVVGEPEEEIISDDVLDARGFRRYHQWEVRLKARSNLKDGWWAGASPAEVEGRPTLVKRYEGPAEQALKAWLTDVKLLQNVFHPSLPQMVGLSQGGAPTPFILLSNVQTRTPQALLLETLKKDGLAACANLILHFYQDVVDAAIYIQRQRELTDHDLQDFVGDASFRVDGSSTMIMGLPRPRQGRWFTARNYGLTESLTMAIMNMLPKGGTLQYKREDDIDNGETTRQISHLVTLTKGLLPADKAPIRLSPRVQALIGSHDDYEDEDDFYRTPKKPKLDLRQLRLSNLDADTHDHAWNENGGIPSHKFSVGDYGYIPEEGKGFDDFIVLGNILKEELAVFATESYARGTHWSWKDIPVHHAPLEPFPLPGDASCWTMVVLPHAQVDCQIVHASSFERVADAWRFLLLNGKDLAAKHNVQPGELMLITRAGTNQDFNIRDFDTQPPLSYRPPQAFNIHPVHQPFIQRPGFNNHAHTMHNHISAIPNNPPAIMYLITSLTPGFEPYWSHKPIAVPPGTARPSLNRGWTYKIGWSTGFVSWIQLHPEDFTD
ncbi:hypothetical protein DXG01_006403 [Tephrocybe rancida]|nr:hypothetical protein DXG01_006403 [Tephrocybe rancida]